LVTGIILNVRLEKNLGVVVLGLACDIEMRMSWLGEMSLTLASVYIRMVMVDG
jgi:hypothetical protein